MELRIQTENLLVKFVATDSDCRKEYLLLVMEGSVQLRIVSLVRPKSLKPKVKKYAKNVMQLKEV